MTQQHSAADYERPAPNHGPAIAGLAHRAAMALRAHGLPAAAIQDEGGSREWSISAGGALILDVGLPDSGASPGLALVRHPGGEERVSVTPLLPTVWPHVGAACRDAVERRALRALAGWAVCGAGRVSRYSQMPESGPWAGIARAGGRVMAIARWDAGYGQRTSPRCPIDALTAQDVAHARACLPVRGGQFGSVGVGGRPRCAGGAGGAGGVLLYAPSEAEGA